MSDKKKYIETKKAILNTQRTIEAAEQLYISSDQALSDACLLILKAWILLANTSITLQEIDEELFTSINNIDTKNFIHRLKNADLLQELSEDKIDGLAFEELIELSYSVTQTSSDVSVERHLVALHKELQGLRKILWNEHDRAKFMFRTKVSVITIVCLSIIGIATYFICKPKEVYHLNFYKGKGFDGKLVEQFKSANIKFNWTRHPIPSVGKTNFSVRASTCMQVNKESEINFSIATDDGSRIIVNNETIHDNWIPTAKVNKTVKHKLPEGRHTVIVEYFQAGGMSEFDFEVEKNSNVTLYSPEKGKCNQG